MGGGDNHGLPAKLSSACCWVMDRRGVPSVRGCALRWEDSVTKCWQNQEISWVDYLATKVRKCWQNQEVSWIDYLPTKVRKRFLQSGDKTRSVGLVTYPPKWENSVTKCWQNQVSWVGYLPTKVRKQCYQVWTKPGGELCWLLTHKGQKTVFQSIDNIGSVVLLLTHQGEKWELKSVRKTKLRDQ